MNNITTFLIKRFPKDLKKEFKALCALKEITMQDYLLDLIRKEVKKANKDK